MLPKLNPIKEIDFEKLRNDILKSKQKSPVLPPTFPTPFELSALCLDVYGEERPPLPDEWVIYADYVEIQKTEHGFGGACYLKFEGGKPIGMIFAFRGTILSWESICNDVSIFRNKIPDQVDVALRFVFSTIYKFRDEYGYAYADMPIDYIKFTGHSLGAVLSDIVVSQLDPLDDYAINSITFENPGSALIVERILREKNDPGVNLEERLELLAKRYETYYPIRISLIPVTRN